MRAGRVSAQLPELIFRLELAGDSVLGACTTKRSGRLSEARLSLPDPRRRPRRSLPRRAGSAATASTRPSMDTIGGSVAAMTAAKLSLTPPPAVAAPAPPPTSRQHLSPVMCYPNLSAVSAAEEARPPAPRQAASSPSSVGGYVR